MFATSFLPTLIPSQLERIAKLSFSLWKSEGNRNLRHDLSRTFEVAVGRGLSQIMFTVYTDVLTQRSEFFRAARSPQWLAVSPDPTKPVDCEDDDRTCSPRI